MSEVGTRKFGYIRVSSKDQHTDRQLSDFKRAGIEKRDIFIEKQSGRDFQRPVYRQTGNQCLYRLSFLWVHPQHLLVQQGIIGCNHPDNLSALPLIDFISGFHVVSPSLKIGIRTQCVVRTYCVRIEYLYRLWRSIVGYFGLRVTKKHLIRVQENRKL